MPSTEAARHWDECWQWFEVFDLDPRRFLEAADTSDRSLFDRIGDVLGKDVLEVGCGNGLFAVFMAKRGANVTAIDASPTAVENTLKLAAANGVGSRVKAYAMDALELERLDTTFDLVFGKFILHHIEPFDRFAGSLSRLVRGNGRGVFLENNSRSPFLMFFRKNVVGRFGVPKHGDDQEYPFEPREAELLRGAFGSVEIHYPEFLFFGLASDYVFRNRGVVSRLCRFADRWFYRHLPLFNRYSYRQIVEFRKT